METTPLLEQIIDTEQVYSLLLYSFILRPYQILKLTHYKVIYKEWSENRFVYITAPSEDHLSPFCIYGQMPNLSLSPVIVHLSNNKV